MCSTHIEKLRELRESTNPICLWFVVFNYSHVIRMYLCCKLNYIFFLKKKLTKISSLFNCINNIIKFYVLVHGYSLTNIMSVNK